MNSSQIGELGSLSIQLAETANYHAQIGIFGSTLCEVLLVIRISKNLLLNPAQI